jgi:hypothetical protein
MNIKFNKNGKILSCGLSNQIPLSDNVISVVDKNLPGDFLHMFALGKYNVDPKKKELIENKKFKMPKRPMFEKLPPSTTGKKRETTPVKVPGPAKSRKASKTKKGSK